MHMLSHTHSTSITSTALIVNVLLVGDKLQMETSHNPPTWGCMSWETNIERARTAKELKGRRGEAELVEKTRRVGLGGGVVRRNQSVPVWKGEEGRGEKGHASSLSSPCLLLPPSLYIPLLSKHVAAWGNTSLLLRQLPVQHIFLAACIFPLLPLNTVTLLHTFWLVLCFQSSYLAQKCHANSWAFFTGVKCFCL